MAGRKTVGWAGNKLDKSGGVNDWAGSNNKFKSFIGNKLKDTGQSVGKRSFDVRATGLGAAAGAAIGANIGKAKEGGYIKDREDKVKRKQKRAQDLEVNEDEGLKRNLNREEINLQVILNAVAPDLGRIDREIEVKKKGRTALVQGSEEDKKVAGEIADLKKQRNAITTAKGSDAVTARTKVSTIQTNLDTARTTATTDIATAKSNKVTEEAKASANTANAKAEAPKNILAAETEEKAAKDKHSTVKMEADTARTTASNATASANANPANQSLQVAAENARTKSAEAEAKLLAAATKLEEAGAKVVSAKNAVSEAEKNEETVKATHESIVSDAEGKVVNLEKNLANAKAVATAAETSAKSGGRSIHQREVEDIPEARNKMETKSRARTTGFANSNAWLGTSTGLEVQHKIIMGNKIDSGEKTH
jgi:hypothetical protein